MAKEMRTSLQFFGSRKLCHRLRVVEASSEVENYLCEERFACGRKLNPLEYWKLKEIQGDFRGLCTLARRVFCATPTIAAIELVFSVAGIHN